MPRHGENIYKRRDGRYEGRYVIGKNATGKTRFGYVYGYQYAEVRNTLLRKKAELLQTVDRNPSRCATLLREWLHRWLESALLGSIKESSYQAYLRQINLHLIPGLGHLRLAQVAPSAVCEFIAEMEASGLAYGTVKGVFRLLNAALRHAQETGVIAQNPCRKIKIQPRETAEQRVLNRSEQEALRKAAIAQGELSTLIGLYTGMRLGEVCALKWSDIDWEKRTIAVRRTVQRTARRTGGAQAARARARGLQSARPNPGVRIGFCLFRNFCLRFWKKPFFPQTVPKRTCSAGPDARRIPAPFSAASSGRYKRSGLPTFIFIRFGTVSP